MDDVAESLRPSSQVCLTSHYLQISVIGRTAWEHSARETVRSVAAERMRDVIVRMRCSPSRAGNAVAVRQKSRIKAEARRHINYVNDTKYSFDAVGKLD